MAIRVKTWAIGSRRARGGGTKPNWSASVLILHRIEREESRKRRVVARVHEIRRDERVSSSLMTDDVLNIFPTIAGKTRSRDRQRGVILVHLRPTCVEPRGGGGRGGRGLLWLNPPRQFPKINQPDWTKEVWCLDGWILLT